MQSYFDITNPKFNLNRKKKNLNNYNKLIICKYIYTTIYFYLIIGKAVSMLSKLNKIIFFRTSDIFH